MRAEVRGWSGRTEGSWALRSDLKTTGAEGPNAEPDGADVTNVHDPNLVARNAIVNRTSKSGDTKRSDIELGPIAARLRMSRQYVDRIQDGCFYA